MVQYLEHGFNSEHSAPRHTFKTELVQYSDNDPGFATALSVRLQNISSTLDEDKKPFEPAKIGIYRQSPIFSLITRNIF